jgi:hypothetical protein
MNLNHILKKVGKGFQFSIFNLMLSVSQHDVNHHKGVGFDPYPNIPHNRSFVLIIFVLTFITFNTYDESDDFVCFKRY